MKTRSRFVVNPIYYIAQALRDPVGSTNFTGARVYWGLCPFAHYRV